VSEFKATCRGPRCGKTITMRDGHPWDAPTKCKHCQGKGTIDVIEQSFFDDGPQAGTIPCSKCKGLGERQVSHFSTCVDAEMFRRKKEAE
jgi:DnaJ-class molecular chaperone